MNEDTININVSGLSISGSSDAFANLLNKLQGKENEGLAQAIVKSATKGTVALPKAKPIKRKTRVYKHVTTKVLKAFLKTIHLTRGAQRADTLRQLGVSLNRWRHLRSICKAQGLIVQTGNRGQAFYVLTETGLRFISE